jgi:transcription termination/antitermination protein NusG
MTNEPAPVEKAASEKKGDTRWYVLRVQSNKEDSVKESLERRVQAAGLADQITRVLVPVEKVTEIKGGKKRVTERKIYPGYVMVEMIFNDETWYLLRETPGIGDFVGSAPGAKPQPMPQHDVDKMLGDAVAAEKETEQPKIKIDFREGDAVKITEGTFENFAGVVKEVNRWKGLVKVEVTIFGRPTPVELEYWKLEAI